MNNNIDISIESLSKLSQDELIEGLLYYVNNAKSVAVPSVLTPQQPNPPLVDDADSSSQSNSRATPTNLTPSTKKPKPQFDMSHHGVRHVALRIAYIGTNYFGFSGVTENRGDLTVEMELFRVLEKSKLAINPAVDCNYAKCGRTDRGVHGFGQVVSLHLRSKYNAGPGIIKPSQLSSRNASKSPSTSSHTPTLSSSPSSSDTPTSSSSSSSSSSISSSISSDIFDSSQELDYPRILNGLLPPDIRVLAWAPVPADFSARFSCFSRVYHYYFFKESLQVDKMAVAAQSLIGEHDFRNFCKLDPVQTINFKRNILRFEIEHVPDFQPPYRSPELQLYRFVIEGSAFLWHQVRCMTEILFMVGKGLESPSVVSELLDVERHPRKPQYGFASEFPLILYDCKFPELRWIYSQADLSFLARDFFSDLFVPKQMDVVVHSRLGLMFEALLEELRSTADPQNPAQEARRRKSKHTPLLKRATCPSVQERVDALTGKKLEVYQKKKDFLESVGYADHPNKIQRID